MRRNRTFGIRGLSPFPNHNNIFLTSHNINFSSQSIEVQRVGDMLATYQHDEHMSVDITPTQGRHASKRHVGPTPEVPLPISFYARLGVPIFGSNFWDSPCKWNSNSFFNSKDSGWKFFEIPMSAKKLIPVICLRRNSVCIIVANLY
jgi:hypothetical protein